jgi:signal transduction histidine kinase
MVLFYALLGWRSYGERERHMESLRPFVASQQLYAHVLTGSGSEPSDVDVATPFRALCGEVLDAESACLYPLGSLASLSGSPLVYPNDTPPSFPWLAEITQSFRSPTMLCTPLEPATHNGYIWGVPLWGERGLIGVLLLGEKRDGSLYTEEEIEIARTVGERLIDTQSSAELARRLMALQRQRLAESRVLDQQTRRTLHDDILPQIHAAMLALGNGASNEESVSLLTDAHRRISALLREMPASPGMQVERQGLIAALRQMVERELAGSFDEVRWNIEPAAEEHVHDVSTMTAEIAFYAAREAMRNAARHGRGGDAQRPLHLTIEATWSSGLRLVIEDDGVGLGGEGGSGGSGQGLAMHGTMMAVVGGAMEMESVVGRYTRVVLVVPEALTPALSQGERE